MAITNRDRVNAAMDLLMAGLRPYVMREMKSYYKGAWAQEIAYIANRPFDDADEEQLDAYLLLKIVWDRWNEVFRQKLSQADRSIVSELRAARNDAAHQRTISSDDAYRTLDSVERLLTAIAAPQVEEAQRAKMEALRVRFDEQSRTVRRRVASSAVEGQPAAGLKPWREIVTPHRDVAAGRFQQAEFAADLSQVHRGDGVAEYLDPREFFRRTYLTEGLRHLLTNALRRLDGTEGGDPVVKLQTNFGGGKTHSMLALYHLFSGVDADSLPGIESVLKDAGVPQPSHANRAVLVGTALSPGASRKKDDGTVVNTLWGEMAWQLLGTRGYAMVAEYDRNGTNPGSDVLRDLFREAEPSLILIDEWVAYVRGIYNIDGLPAGSFDSNLTFAQSLTEAARAVPGTLVVASLPASDIETGGEAGRDALARLENTFSRVESVWKPASSQEGFEIVRRRLFEDIPADLIPQRDAVVRAFIDLYKQNANDFPPGRSEADYERQMRAAYPIHPELFDRLYEDWSQLERFQRTRGVLRLMASVIHTLWDRDDRSLLIMPASIPMDDPAVQYELTRYLEDTWQPVIEKDVDGPNALPREIDDANRGTLGRYSATRRVARAVYLGSAPLKGAANIGLDDRHIRLGCVQPGESVATFGDALRRLANSATYLYTDNVRYWYSTTPTVNRLAQDRAAQLRRVDVLDQIRKQLRDMASARGPFARVHAAPVSSGDVPDDDEVRLVILDPEHVHSGRQNDSPARAAAQALLDTRGSSPRLYRNMLVFLAPDARQLETLEQGMRELIAWESIKEDSETLNLDAFQRNQVKTKWTQAVEAVKQRIPEAYVWVLAPEQPEATGSIEWQEARTQGQGSLTERAARRLINDGLLITDVYAYSLLRLELDRIPLWQGDDIGVRDLWNLFAKYVYLPRLRDSNLLLETIKSGVGQMLWRTESWAYAQRKDEAGRYHGLTVTPGTGVAMDGFSLLVKAEAAQRQLEEEERQRREIIDQGDGETAADLSYSVSGGPDATAVAPPVIRETKPRRFHGSVEIDPQRVSTSAGQIGQEVIQHLTALLGADVRVTLEIAADIPDGASEQTVRTVMENARTLRFQTYEFEKE